MIFPRIVCQRLPMTRGAVCVVRSRTGHIGTVIYDQERYMEAQWAVRKWLRKNWLTNPEAGSAMIAIARQAEVEGTSVIVESAKRI